MRNALTQEDLTASFNTSLLKGKLQQLSHEGRPLILEQTKITITDGQFLRMESAIRIGQAEQTIEVIITARLVVEDRRKIQF